MRAKMAMEIRGTDALYVPEIDSISFSENVVDWRPGERVAFRPFRFPLPHSLIVAAFGGLVAGILFRTVGGGTRLAFFTGATLGGFASFRLIRGARRTIAFDWRTRHFEDRHGFRVRRAPFADLVALELRAIEDRPLGADEPIRYRSVLSLITPNGSVELLHATTVKDIPLAACRALRPAAQWLSVTLELPLETKCAANDPPAREDDADSMPISPEQERSTGAEDYLAQGELALIRAKYAEEVAGAEGAHRAEAAPFLRDALEAFSRVNQADPRSVEGLLAIAKVCEEMDDPANANMVYTKALTIDPNRAEVYSRRGFNHELEKKFDSAIADYSEAIRLEPGEEEHYRHRGNANTQAKRYADAASDFARFLELTAIPALSKGLDSLRQSRRATVLADRALAYWKMGDRELAQADVNQALELDCDNSFAREVETILRHGKSLE